MRPVHGSDRGHADKYVMGRSACCLHHSPLCAIDCWPESHDIAWARVTQQRGLVRRESIPMRIGYLRSNNGLEVNREAPDRKDIMMRKLIVQTFLTLDGVMQAPGGPDEDDSGGFACGGWSVNYWDEQMGEVMGEATSKPFAMVLGRRTYDIMAAYWPHASEEEGGPVFNEATKYVASRSRPPWNGATRSSSRAIPPKALLPSRSKTARSCRCMGALI